MVNWIGIVPLGERLLVRSGSSWFPSSYHFNDFKDQRDEFTNCDKQTKCEQLPKSDKMTKCDNKIQNQRRMKKFEYQSRLMVANSFAAGEATEEKYCSTHRNFEDPVVSS